VKKVYYEVIIYDWPHSQLCMDCGNGEFVESETYRSSDYICTINSVRNTGTHCPDRIGKEGGD